MPGLFFAPTVFTDVEDHMMIAEEESFGPVMIISKFQHGFVYSLYHIILSLHLPSLSSSLYLDVEDHMMIAEEESCYDHIQVSAWVYTFSLSNYALSPPHPPLLLPLSIYQH